MKLKDYLILKKIKKKDFAVEMRVSRVTLDWWIRNPHRVTHIVKLAIEFVTGGEVRREDW